MKLRALKWCQASNLFLGIREELWNVKPEGASSITSKVSNAVYFKTDFKVYSDGAFKVSEDGSIK